MRVVLDTNVIVSAVMFGGLPEKLLVKILSGDHVIVISPYIIEETNRILRTKFSSKPDSLKLLNDLLKEADIQYFVPFIHVLSDEPDNRILETAVVGKAEIIVTGDKLLLDQKKYKDVLIVKPALLMEALKLTLQ